MGNNMCKGGQKTFNFYTDMDLCPEDNSVVVQRCSNKQIWIIYIQVTFIHKVGEAYGAECI